MSKPRSKSKPRPRNYAQIETRPLPPQPNESLWHRIPDWSKYAVSISAGLAAILYLSANLFQPVLLSRLPSASQADLRGVDVAHQSAEAIIKEGLDGVVQQLQSLDVRQQQSLDRGTQLLQTVTELKIASLREKLVEARRSLMENPNDRSAQTLILDYEGQMNRLLGMTK